MEIIIEDNKYLERFFKHYKGYSEKLKYEIYSNIQNIILNRFYKIKDIKGLKYRGKTAYEYKIILDKSFVCRVAYIIEDNIIIVFYISTNTIKAEFTKEVSHIKNITK